MSEFKGTKGEWTVKRYKHGFKLSGQSWEDFAKIYTISDGSDFDGKYAIEAEANAKLIACAPEMLKAMNEFIEAVESQDIIIKENTDNDGFEAIGEYLYQSFLRITKKATTL